MSQSFGVSLQALVWSYAAVAFPPGGLIRFDLGWSHGLLSGCGPVGRGRAGHPAIYSARGFEEVVRMFSAIRVGVLAAMISVCVADRASATMQVTHSAVLFTDENHLTPVTF